MSSYVFQAGGVRVELGDLDDKGRIAVGAAGAGALGAGELAGATDARSRALAEAVEAARLRFQPELDKLAAARAVHAQAVAEHDAATAAVNKARHDHRMALQRAENPAATRQKVAEAETRLHDAAVWVANAAVRRDEADRAAKDSAGIAWRAEVAARRPDAEVERGKLARSAAELFADLARVALAGFPIDAVIFGWCPVEELVADEPAQPPALKLAAG